MPRVPKHRRVWKPVSVQCPGCDCAIVTGVDATVEILRWNHTDVVSAGLECPGCGMRIVVRRWYQTIEVTAGSVVGAPVTRSRGRPRRRPTHEDPLR